MKHITITASEGKIFKRIVDGTLYGKEITLGYTHYINGVKQVPPHKDVKEDFEEIDDPSIVVWAEFPDIEEVDE